MSQKEMRKMKKGNQRSRLISKEIFEDCIANGNGEKRCRILKILVEDLKSAKLLPLN